MYLSTCSFVLFCFLHASHCLDITETLAVWFVQSGAHEEFYFLCARSWEETLYIYSQSPCNNSGYTCVWVATATPFYLLAVTFRVTSKVNWAFKHAICVRIGSTPDDRHVFKHAEYTKEEEEEEEAGCAFNKENSSGVDWKMQKWEDVFCFACCWTLILLLISEEL